MDYGRLSSVLWHQESREVKAGKAGPAAQGAVEQQRLGLSDWEAIISSLNSAVDDKSLENELAASLFAFRETVKKYRKCSLKT